MEQGGGEGVRRGVRRVGAALWTSVVLTGTLLSVALPVQIHESLILGINAGKQLF